MVVLELGCGTGIITQALANRMLEQHAGLGGVRVVGVDASAEMLRIAAARNDRIEWIKDDMREPSVEGRFDLVVCCYHTLQYMLTEEDMIRVFNSVRLLLRPCGVFAFDIYQPNFDYLSIPRTDHLIRLQSMPKAGVSNSAKMRPMIPRPECFNSIGVSFTRSRAVR